MNKVKPYAPVILIMFLLIFFSDDLWGVKLIENSRTPKEHKEKVEKAPMAKGQIVEKQPEVDTTKYVTMDFDGVDITVFIKFIADVTGKNFIIGDKVSGKVTVISPRKMTLPEAYKVFESVLEVNGYTTVPMNGIIKVVKTAEAQTKSLETRFKGPVHPEDRMVTQIIPLRYADSNDMKTLLAPLMSKRSSEIMAYPQTNMLIITDTLSNIKRLMEILKAIDIPGSTEEVQIFPLSYASAANLSTKLSEILTEETRKTRRVRPRPGTLSSKGEIKIIPDERTNSLIVLAPIQEIDGIGELIKRLDVPTPMGKEDVHVYYLQYANAEDIAKVLTEIPTPGVAKEAAAKKSSIKQEVKISPDKDTNSLVIYADPQAYAIIVDTIKHLDIPRKQVYVKALIMEINVKRDFKIGVEWTAFEDFTYDSGEKIGGVLARTGANFISSPADIPAGPVLGVVGQAITINKDGTEITFPNITSFINAMKSDTDVNILSTPQIITMDNKEAEITVGKNVPYVTSEQVPEETTGRVTRVYDYRDVGVTLRLTPQINQEGNIRMEVFQEITTLVEGKGELEYAPTTLKRSATTTVVIKDNNTMVIGGLIGEELTYTNYRVPLLGDLPIIGYLFKSRTKKREKTNLYIFLTPAVIDTEEKASKLYKEKYGEIKAAHDALGKGEDKK
ncbi:MAG: type II secretion system secretin GspD [Deltaproteobacteria bacterium]|nr:type II secretion system secretin GspD [Deltaproteobacteria bacterium]